MPCGWGVKTGMVRVWVAGKTVLSPCYTRAISERFRDKELTDKALYKFAFFTFLLLYLTAIATRFWPILFHGNKLETAVSERSGNSRIRQSGQCVFAFKTSACQLQTHCCTQQCHHTDLRNAMFNRLQLNYDSDQHHGAKAS